jgi:hypothetical protein
VTDSSRASGPVLALGLQHGPASSTGPTCRTGLGSSSEWVSHWLSSGRTTRLTRLLCDSGGPVACATGAKGVLLMLLVRLIELLLMMCLHWSCCGGGDAAEAGGLLASRLARKPGARAYYWCAGEQAGSGGLRRRVQYRHYHRNGAAVSAYAELWPGGMRGSRAACPGRDQQSGAAAGACPTFAVADWWACWRSRLGGTYFVQRA